MSLSHHQPHSVRAGSEPPSPSAISHRRGSGTKSVDPSGRYKGDRFDPYYHLKKKQHRQQANGRGWNRNHQGNGGHDDRAGTGTLAQTISGQTQQLDSSSSPDRRQSSSPSHSQVGGYSYSQPNTYTRPNTYAPGARTQSQAATPSAPLAPAVAAVLSSERPRLTMHATPTPAAGPGPNADEPSWVKDQEKEEGEITASSSPASVKAHLHPYRLGLVAGRQSSSSEVSYQAQDLPRPATTAPILDNQGQEHLQRNSKPTPLTSTPMRDGSTHTNDSPSTPITPSADIARRSSAPTSLLSTATTPLDSLEKLRQFKDQVAASRTSGRMMSGQEMSKLAQMAETFLKSQKPEASADALEQLKQTTGSAEELGLQSAIPLAPATAPSQGPEGQQTSTPDSREAELKERLLAARAGNDGYSKSPRNTSQNGSPVGQALAQAQQSAAQANGSTPTIKRDGPPHPDEQSRGQDDPRRARAHAWQTAREIDSRLHRIEADMEPAPPPSHAQQAAPTRAPYQHQQQYQRGRSMTTDNSMNSIASRAPVRPSNNSDNRQPPAGPSARRDSFAQGRQTSGGRYEYNARDNRFRDRSRSPVARRPDYRPNGHDRGPGVADTRDQLRQRISDRPPVASPPSGRGYQQRHQPNYAHRSPGRDAPRRQPSPVRPRYSREPYDDRAGGRVPEPRYTRDETYTRPAPRAPLAQAPESYPAPQAPQIPPQPAPLSVLTPTLPAIDSATVHATLDILKAQIAILEASMPAPSSMTIASPVAAYDPYRTTAAPVPAPASVPPPQPAAVTAPPFKQDYQSTYESQRSGSPPSRAFRYENRQPAPAAERRPPAPRSASPDPARRYAPSGQREGYQARTKNGCYGSHQEKDNTARYSYDTNTRKYTQDNNEQRKFAQAEAPRHQQYQRQDQNQDRDNRKTSYGYDNRSASYTSTYVKNNNRGTNGYHRLYQPGGYDNRAQHGSGSSSYTPDRGGRGGATRGRGRGGAARGGYDQSSRGDYAYNKT